MGVCKGQLYALVGWDVCPKTLAKIKGKADAARPKCRSALLPDPMIAVTTVRLGFVKWSPKRDFHFLRFKSSIRTYMCNGFPPSNGAVQAIPLRWRP